MRLRGVMCCPPTSKQIQLILETERTESSPENPFDLWRLSPSENIRMVDP